MEPLSLPLSCNPKLHYPSLLEGFLYSPTSFYLAIISVEYLSRLHKEQSYCSVSFFTCSKSPPFWFLPVTMYQDAFHKCVLTFLHRGKRIILGSVTQYRTLKKIQQNRYFNGRNVGFCMQTTDCKCSLGSLPCNHSHSVIKINVTVIERSKNQSFFNITVFLPMKALSQ